MFPSVAEYKEHRYLNCKGRRSPPPITVEVTTVPAEIAFLTNVRNSGLTLADAQAFVAGGSNINCLDAVCL